MKCACQDYWYLEHLIEKQLGGPTSSQSKRPTFDEVSCPIAWQGSFS